MDVITSLFTISVAACIGGAAVCSLEKKRKKHSLQWAMEIMDDVDTGLYGYEPGSGREFFSPHLHGLLKLDASMRDLESLLLGVGEPAGNSIRMALENLAAGGNSTIILMTSQDKMRHFECRISGVHSGKSKLAQVLICFRDITARHNAHEQLVKENRQLKRDVKQFSTILNSLPVPVWMRDSGFSIRYCNMAYSMAAEESIEHKGDTETLELHPYSKAFARAAYEAGQERTERRHIVVEGARRFYQFSEVPIPADQITVGVAQDLSELEAVKEELQRHVNAQSELLESTNSAMAVFGADMRLKFFNQAYMRLWGLDEALLESGPTCSEVLEVLRENRRLPEQANFPQFKQQQLKLFTQLIAPHEEILYLPDGRTLRVLAIPHALGGILFAYEDVTDRLALERSYNTLIAVQRATLDNLHEGVVVFGEDGRLRLYNPRFLQLWKLEKAVLSPETHISDLIDKTRPLHYSEDWQQYKQQFIARLLTREVQHRRIERTDGSIIDSVVVPLPDGASLITFYDITDSMLVERSLRERNEALSEADRLKTEFLANVSYELRSPLTSISGFSEMLMHNYFGTLSSKQQEYVAAIHQASQRLMSLINDILDIASVEAGYMKLNIGTFSIETMLQSVIALVSERMRESSLQFVLRCQKNIGEMAADETRIKQIIFNLLSNAIKFSNLGGGMIILAVHAVKGEKDGADEILFMIEDDGIGIAPEEQKLLFNKFYRGENSAGHKTGAGLGLSMVKSFVELHGGRVELFSVPAKGTKVSCYLPRYTVA